MYDADQLLFESLEDRELLKIFPIWGWGVVVGLLYYTYHYSEHPLA